MEIIQRFTKKEKIAKQAVVKLTESFSEYEGGDLTEITLTKIEPLITPSAEPIVMTFSNPINARVVLSRYDLGNLSVTCCLMMLHGKDTVGLSFKIGDNEMDTHGVIFGTDITAIPTDFDGNAITLSTKLPESFEKWVRSLELLTWN